MNILSAGAAKGLLTTIAAHAGLEFDGEFGAVGAMRERLDSRAACDVIVLTEKMITELAARGVVDAESVIALGRVRTGVALPAVAKPERVGTTAELTELLANASRIYFPDPERATAGIHFMKVLKTLGLAESHRDRFATFPNGATAMRAMADAGEVGAVGVTQCSEILYTEGVQLIGALPGEFELATVYSAACTATTAKATPDRRRDATRLLGALASADNAAIRIGAGFEPIDS
jgi:molybdate transport system substrate-binding protein